MSHFFSLVKATFSQDLNIFNYKSKNTTSTLKKFLLPLALGLIVMLSVGIFADTIAKVLHDIGATDLILTVCIALITILTIVEGIYKSQSILFDCKDNDILLSLPIPKSQVLAVRVLKLITFQFLYNLVFILPVFVVYAIYEQPGPAFYLTSTVATFLLPLIPTAIAILVGSLIRRISFRFKFQKIIQTLSTLIVLLIVVALSAFAKDVINGLAQNATSINDTIGAIYYPVQAYRHLIVDFSLLEFLAFLAFNILPLAVAIWLCSHNYFKTISKTKAHSRTVALTDFNQIKSHTPTVALVKKELNRYFSSTVYMVNTLFGLILMTVMTVTTVIIGPNILTPIGDSTEIPLETVIDPETGAEIELDRETPPALDPEAILAFLPIVYILLIIFTSCLTSITSSSISIEGKSFNITKSLPVSPTDIFRGKLLMALVISVPLILICDILFILRFTPSPLFILYILGFTILVPAFSALLGLIMNLKYPKLNASNDAEIVKQSTSATMCVFIGFGVIAFTVAPIVIFMTQVEIVTGIILLAFALIDLLLWHHHLCRTGSKRFEKLTI